MSERRVHVRDKVASIHHLEVARTARVLSLGPTPVRPRADLWVACHGYRQLATRFIQRFTSLDDGRRSVVAPEGLSRFYLDESGGSHGPDARIGATWMTREDRDVEIADYVGYLDRVVDRWKERTDRVVEWDIPEPGSGEGAVIGLGFSQGCHTVTRWLAMGRTRVHRLVLWGAYLPVDPEPSAYLDRLKDVEVILVRGVQDPYTPEAVHDRQVERIRKAGIEVREVTHPGGHQMDSEVLAQLA